MAVTHNYLKYKYGLFVHYAYGDAEEPVTRNADGTNPTSLDDLADRFDVEAFVGDVVSFGVEYVIFTAWHYRMNMLYPSVVMDAWRGGHASRRDVIGELIDRLKGTGVALYLYTHPADGHDFSAEDQERTGWNGPAPYEKWNAFINAVYEEVTVRYGRDVEGYLFDSTWPEQVDRSTLRKTILSRQGDLALVALYDQRNECCDYCSKEVRFPDEILWFNEYPPITRYDVSTWPSYRRLVAIVQGGDWCAAGGSAQYTAEMMFRYTVLQAATATESAGVVWSAGPYPGGRWETNVRERFQALGSCLAPIAESIKCTYPSTSYVTAEGSKILTLPWGVVATRSVDDRYEYIHVLIPPAEGTIHLPPPADGKRFVSAALLTTGEQASMTQTARGVDLALPKGFRWDTLDAVFRLTVRP